MEVNIRNRIAVIGIVLVGGGVFLARCSGSTSPSPPPPPPRPGSRLPAAPVNLVATPVSTSEISLTWQDKSDNEDAFVIERCLADWEPPERQGCPQGAGFSFVVSVGPNVTGYTNQDLTAADSYGYRVFARNATGKSEYSNTAMATALVGGPPPAAPTGLGAGNLQAFLFCFVGGCIIVWDYDLWWQDNSHNEDGFLIEECWGAECTTFTRWYTVPANSTGLHFGPGSAACGWVWTWRVRAHNAGGYSEPSNPVAVSTLDHPICP